MLAFLVAAGTLAAVAFMLARSVTRPITAMTAELDRLTAGDTSFQAGTSQRRDEFGKMEQALAELRTVARRSFELVQMFDQMPTNILGCSMPDFTINYMNRGSKTLLRRLARQNSDHTRPRPTDRTNH